MKKGHLLLIIISLIILVIVAIYAIIVKLNTQEPYEPGSVINNTKLEEITDRNNYYMVENCVNKFYNYYASIYENKNPEEEDVVKTYNLLDEQYIEFKGITKENLFTILPKKNNSVVNIYSMYGAIVDPNINLYIVEGILREEVSNELSNFKIMVRVDIENQTFSVLLQDYIEYKYPNLKLEDNIKIELTNNIELNRNNGYVYEQILDKTYVLDLFDRYKEEALYNIELAYDHLDKEYESIKFGSVEKFKKYISNNLETNIDVKLEQYLVTEEENYIQYVCVDENGYYYIFREFGLFDYRLILDTYTIDLPEFLEKYNNASTVDRVGYNVQKCLDALNNKDYSYVYDKLDFEFKALNYPVQEEFERDIKAKLFSRNKVNKVKSYREGYTYIFRLTIADENDNTKEQDMTIVMQLKEGTDFVMSLSFQ